MVEIIPAILVKDKRDFSSKIAAVAPYVKRVQIDIMDGKCSQYHFGCRGLRSNPFLHCC